MADTVSSCGIACGTLVLGAITNPNRILMPNMPIPWLYFGCLHTCDVRVEIGRICTALRGKMFYALHLDSANCRMRVIDEWVQWEEGKALIFDDVVNHEVRNDTDETRIVLLIQFKRPVGIVGKIVGGLFLEGVRRSRFVQDARRGIANWTAERAGA